MVTLQELFGLWGQAAPPVPVRGITHDSRQVEPGYVFVALEGIPLPSRPPLDGHRFVEQALARGAVGVVGTQPLHLDRPYLRVEQGRQALARLAAYFWGEPAHKLQLIGVTGSKGKSTVSLLAQHLLNEVRSPAGLISTLGVRIGQEHRWLEGHFTTPEAPQVQQTLAQFVEAGCQQGVLEVSSHALALERVGEISFAVAVFTNLFPDHLDFHGDMEAYFAAKASLLDRADFSVIYADNPYTQRLLPRAHTWTYGSQADWSVTQLRETPRGLDFWVVSPLGEFAAFLPILGGFNASNALAAMAATARLGLSISQLQEGLAGFPGVPGRMQLVQQQPFRVVIDFAHTGASLQQVLQALRPQTQGRLILVVGAAGQQDPSRRTGIAQVAAQLADFTVFTEEDHRTESLQAILDTMAQTAQQSGGQFICLPDRAQAIRHAIGLAQPGDTVVLAGKGHERTLERGHEVIPWNEADEVRQALAGA